MRAGDTIVALSSAPGRSPRALLRLSGPGTALVLRDLLGTDLTERHASCAVAHLTAAIELPVLVCRFKAPRSYTGEDSAEIQLPGNPYLVERVLARLIATPGVPVRAAQPGEFTARAYLNGKLTLEQAEGIGATIAAQTAEQLEAASHLAAGTTGARYRAWADQLTTLLALVEAGIDFSDQEDVVPIPGEKLAERLDELAGQIGEFLGARAGSEVAGALPTVVLVGAPNAGKSTLFNALLGRTRAVVTPIAGTTRDVLRETLDLSRDHPGASPVTLADLAGLDEGAGGVAAQEAQSAARRAIADSDLVIYCDPLGRFPALPGLPTGHPVIRVRTKADLPGPTPTTPTIPASTTTPTTGTLPVCALDRWNLGALRRAIADAACSSRAAGEAALVPRHRHALAGASAGIADARRPCVRPGRLRDPELIAGSLRQALDALGGLVGNISPDDVLGRVFSTFCVGK